jgi:DNA-binding transcriptional LysR family regulator
MVETADQALSDMAELQDRPTGVLRITAPVNYGTSILCPLAAEFLDNHRDLNIDFLLLDRVVNLIDEGIDLAFRLGPLQDSNLIARRLKPIHHYLCATPGYLALFAFPDSPRELRQHQCLPHGSRAIWRFEHNSERITVPMKGRLNINNLQGLKNAALAGLGIVRLPDYMCAHELRNGHLIHILAKWPEPPTECHAIYPDARHLPLKVRRFLDHVIDGSATSAARESENRQSDGLQQSPECCEPGKILPGRE